MTRPSVPWPSAHACRQYCALAAPRTSMSVGGAPAHAARGSSHRSTVLARGPRKPQRWSTRDDVPQRAVHRSTRRGPPTAQREGNPRCGRPARQTPSCTPTWTPSAVRLIARGLRGTYFCCYSRPPPYGPAQAYRQLCRAWNRWRAPQHAYAQWQWPSQRRHAPDRARAVLLPCLVRAACRAVGLASVFGLSRMVSVRHALLLWLSACAWLVVVFA